MIFIDLHCFASVPFVFLLFHPQYFVTPASFFLSKLNGKTTTTACIRHCFHYMEHLFHYCTMFSEIVRKSVALREQFHMFFFFDEP